MPRNITVTLADGSQHVYANTPDTVTPEQVSARAQRDFKQSVNAIDGGRGSAPAQRMPGFYNDASGKPAIYSPKLAAASKTPPPTQADRIRSGARARADQHSDSTGNFLTALKGGATRYMFGIPERLAAAGEAYLPSAITGNTTNASYDNILATIRGNTDADMEKSTAGAIAGGAIGSIATGRAVTGAVAPLASRAAAAASPIIQRAGNALQGLLTLRKGQMVANAAKLATTGGAAGGAQAVGEGSDPVRGVVTGAIAAPVIGGSLKLTQVLTRPLRDFLRTSSAGQILSRFTTVTADELTARAAAYRQATGAEPTVFELLPLVDRNKILKQGITGRDNIVERASNAIRARAANLGPEMSALAERTTGPRREAITRSMENDMSAARGAPDAGDPALAGRASTSPTDMLDLRDQEARAIMAPHEATPVAGTFGDILPQTPVNNGGTITMTDADPAVTAAIRSAAPSGFRVADQGVSAGDIADMISTLRGDLSKGGIEGRTAQRAIDHLESVLGAHAPDAAAAHAQMTDAYAARSRMAEGMQEGGATRLRNDIPVGTSRRQARTVRNAYDTPEGDAGRVLGQSNRVLSDLGGSPEDALKATIKMARGTTGRALAENLGPAEAETLMAGARAQDTSAQALAAASEKAAGGQGAGLDAEGLVQALVGLHPSSFATTKAGAIRKLVDMTYVPESRARVMVDMLFSQDPAMTARAINAIGNSPNGAAFSQYLAGAVGQASGSGPSSLAPADAPTEAETPAETAAEPGEEAGAPVFMADPAPTGLVEPGNIDLNSRTPVDNGDGTYSTVRTISIGTDKGEVLIPTVVDGKVVSDAQAVAQYKKTGEHLGIFQSPASADAYANKLHEQQASAYGKSAPAVGADPNVPYGRQVIQSIFPEAHITEDVRDPNSKLGKENPNSEHIKTQNAVDVRPIPGMTFAQFIDKIHAKGHTIIEAIDEVNHPSKWATGKHWHVVIAG